MYLVLSDGGHPSPSRGVQATCFLLRELGFSCLAPSARDFGLSGKSSHPNTLTWGYDAWIPLVCLTGREREIYIYNYIIIYIYEGLLLSVTRPLDVACLWVYKYHQIPLGISRNSPWYLEKYPLKSSKNTPSHHQKYPLTSRKIPLENFPKYPDA